MQWNNKVLAFATLGAAATLVLAGCSGGSSSGSASGGDGGYKIAFVQGVAGDEFYISMQCGIQSEAAK
ncbi:hypothetical protein DEU35_3375, partial [Microbacterium sp. AG157]